LRHTIKGKYCLKNPKKYTARKDDIIYRSSLELALMTFLDSAESVLEWSSESVVIPYKSPVDNRKRRYYIDFYAKIKNKNGEIKKYLIEVKPKKFTKPPKKRNTNAYIKEVKEYLKNQAKWSAASSYCKSRDMEFKIITEEELK